MDKPHIHLTPERNWLNDPVGFLYLKGEYHIFHQYFPYAMHRAPCTGVMPSARI